MTKLNLEYTKIEYIDIVETVDVTFPIYRKDIYGSTSVYMKINEDLSAIRLDIRGPTGIYDNESHRVYLTLIDRYDFDHDIKWRRNVDFLLGYGEYALTEEQFYSELKQVNTLIAELLKLDREIIE